MRDKIYSILESDNSSAYIYEKIMYVCIIASIIPLCFKEQIKLFFWLDKITVSVFIIDYLLRWATADKKHKYKPAAAFIRYPFSFFAIVDLMSILPSLTPLGSGFKLFRLFRLSKAVRALKLLRYSKSFNLIVNVIKEERKSLLAVCALAGFYIFVSALIMFQIEPESFDNFFSAIYWAMVTLTTVGYGDIYPVSQMGRIISMLSSFMGIAIVALPTGIITAGYTNELNKGKENDLEGKQ